MLNIDINIDSKSIIISVFIICTTTLIGFSMKSCNEYEQNRNKPIKSGEVRIEAGYKIIGTDSTIIFTSLYNGETLKIVNKITGTLIVDNE